VIAEQFNGGIHEQRSDSQELRRHSRYHGCHRSHRSVVCVPASAQTVATAPKVEYAIKKLPFDPAKIKGISEKLLVSHYENNYGGAVKRLNAITAPIGRPRRRGGAGLRPERPQARGN